MDEDTSKILGVTSLIAILIRFSEHQTVAYSMALLLIHDNKQIIRLCVELCSSSESSTQNLSLFFDQKFCFEILQPFCEISLFQSRIEPLLRVNLRRAAAGRLSLSLSSAERGCTRSAAPASGLYSGCGSDRGRSVRQLPQSPASARRSPTLATACSALRTCALHIVSGTHACPLSPPL